MEDRFIVVDMVVGVGGCNNLVLWCCNILTHV